MKYNLEKLSDEYRKPVIDIFNYFIENSFAAFPEIRVDYDFYDKILNMSRGYPSVVVKDNIENVIGFAFLHAYHPIETFKRVAEISYFIMPEYTRKGIGKNILDRFYDNAKILKIDSILACISSLNEKSIRFHLKNGFKECGRFKNIGRKFGMDFDVIWMQKII
ncbi:MAG: N-acetyltransferase family protein [bacterium]